MMNNTVKRDHQCSIRLHGVELMKGDTRYLADVFNNLEGRNFDPTGIKEQTREQWLASMSAELKTPLNFGERIVIATPEDHVLRESVVGKFIQVDVSSRPPRMKKKSMQYAWNLLSLWANRKIDRQTVWRAIRERPMAVCGKGGTYHVDPFDPNVPMAKEQ